MNDNLKKLEAAANRKQKELSALPLAEVEWLDESPSLSSLQSEIAQLKEERGRIKKIIEERIAYLIEQEEEAIDGLDGIPAGTEMRAVQWNFVNELGHRKNELQYFLTKIPLRGVNDKTDKT